VARVDVTGGRVRAATPWFVALLVVGGVALGLVVNEALRQVAPPSGSSPESFGAAGPSGPAISIDTIDLGSLSPPDAFELALAGALALARFVLALMRRRRLLEPLVDLPLIGVLLAVNGGALSPLDPTLPLAYVAAILFLRGAESGRATPKRLTLELLVGLAAIHAIAQRHDRRRLDDGAAAQRERLGAAISAIRADHEAPLASVDEALRGLHEPVESLRAPLADAQARFRELLLLLTPDVDAGRLGDAKSEWQAALDATYERYFKAREAWLEARPAAESSVDVDSLDLLRETQWNLREELLERVDDLENALVERDRLRGRQQAYLSSSTRRRAAIFGALLLFAALAVVLRDRLSAAVRESEERRARREVELAERDKENWIALTAGLTHGLGNDILAYDVYLAELQRLLAAPSVGAPPRALELLRFLADSNRGRLGFLQFLDAFARHRQSAAGDAPPIAFEPLDLPSLLSRVRQNLARVETADLPPEGSDPAVDRQLRKLRDLPIDVQVADERARTLVRGHRGIVEFFVYELTKNALRSATGARPLVASLARAGDRLELSIENDVEVDLSRGACPRCGRDGELRRVRRRRDAPAACPACFGPALQELLDQSFAPGKGSGTGLGLFLIRYFLGAFWNGEIGGRVLDPAVPSVVFTLALQDPA